MLLNDKIQKIYKKYIKNIKNKNASGVFKEEENFFFYCIITI